MVDNNQEQINQETPVTYNRALPIANYLVEKGIKSNTPLTPLQLVKMVYIAYGWHLGLTGKKLFEQPIYAWKHGPVIKPIYHTFKDYQSSPIIKPASEALAGILYGKEELTDFTKGFLDKIYDVYSKYSGIDLTNMTHQEGTPWYTAWEVLNGKNVKDVIIPDRLIEDHYKEKANSN